MNIPDKSQSLGGVDVGSPIIKKALAFSLTDGIFCSVMVAMAETFSVAAAVKLNAPAMTIALLGSAPLLVGSIGQFFLPLFLHANNTRKQYVVTSVRVQALFLILAGLTGFLPAPYNAWFFVFAFILYGSSGNLFGGIWMSWLRDSVPQNVRGRHFAWRNRFFSMTQLICALTAGFIARKYSSETVPWLFFTLIFFIGSLFRFGSSLFLSWQYDPKPYNLPNKKHVFNFKPSKNFLWFCSSVALLQGTTAIAGPFFNVWFLKDLNFNYLTFTISSACTILGTFVFLPLWGKLIDAIGTSRVLRITGLFCAFVPVLYCFFPTAYAIWIFNFYSGAVWGGFNIANFNYLLRATEKEHTDHYIAFTSAATSTCLFVFGLLGGYLATHLPTFFEYQLQSLFFISFVGRLIVVLVLFRKFKQPEMSVDSGTLEIVHEASGYKSGIEIIRQIFRIIIK